MITKHLFSICPPTCLLSPAPSLFLKYSRKKKNNNFPNTELYGQRQSGCWNKQSATSFTIPSWAQILRSWRPPTVVLAWQGEVCQRPIRLVSSAELYKLTGFIVGGNLGLFLQEDGTRPPECLPASALGFTHSWSSLNCVSSAPITNGGAGGSYSARPGPRLGPWANCSNWVGGTAFLAIPSLPSPVWRGMNGGPLQLLLAAPVASWAMGSTAGMHITHSPLPTAALVLYCAKRFPNSAHLRLCSLALLLGWETFCYNLYI